MINLMPIISVFLITETTGQLQCGFPGRPKNGVVSITFHSSNSVAKYGCPGSFIIDGDAERTCRDDGTWTGTIPRCATEAPHTKSVAHDQLTDGNLETCDWIHEANTVMLEFEKKLQVYVIKMIYSKPYGESLKEAVFGVQVMNGEQITGTGVNRTFHERDPIYGSKDFSSVQWRLNGSGNAVLVGLKKGNAYICDIQVLTSPEECGEAEAPRNGRIEYTDIFHALCRCDTHYQVDGASSVRKCSDGRWSGEQCACRPIDIEENDMLTNDMYVFIIVLLLITTIVLPFVIFKSEIYSLHIKFLHKKA